MILNEIQPLLIGKDVFNIEGCWELMCKPSTNILRDRKLAMCAQACVDSALWDAVGKALDAPLYKLWGGYSDQLRPSASLATMRKARRSPTSDARWSRSNFRVMQAANSRSEGELQLRMPNACGSHAKRWARIRPRRRRQPELDAATGGRILPSCRRPQYSLV